MAGKSTVMRSLCAVALLSACGLFAPCKAATIPYIDAFMLRTFSADSPVEGKSSFAIEMSEMRCTPARDIPGIEGAKIHKAGPLQMCSEDWQNPLHNLHESFPTLPSAA